MVAGWTDAVDVDVGEDRWGSGRVGQLAQFPGFYQAGRWSHLRWLLGVIGGQGKGKGEGEGGGRVFSFIIFMESAMEVTHEASGWSARGMALAFS